MLQNSAVISLSLSILPPCRCCCVCSAYAAVCRRLSSSWFARRHRRRRRCCRCLVAACRCLPIHCTIGDTIQLNAGQAAPLYHPLRDISLWKLPGHVLPYKRGVPLLADRIPNLAGQALRGGGGGGGEGQAGAGASSEACKALGAAHIRAGGPPGKATPKWSLPPPCPHNSSPTTRQHPPPCPAPSCRRCCGS